MKNREIVSATIGGVFFAVPYLVLSAPLLPSLAIGAAAFGAGELVFGDYKLTLKETNRSLYDMLEDAKKKNKHIVDMIPMIEDEEIKKELNEINDSVTKIIDTISKNPKKIDQTDNFFDYYLPITVKLVDRYDEIENQKLSSTESKKFFASTNKMVREINKAYKKILDNLYKKVINNLNEEEKKDEKDTIFDLIAKEFDKKLSPIDMEIINGWLELETPEELIKGALKEASYNGVKTLRYMDQLIYEWSNKGFKTMEDVNNHMKSKSNNKNNEKLFDYDWLEDDE